MTQPRKGDRYLWDSEDGRIVVEVTHVSRSGMAVVLEPIAVVLDHWKVPIQWPLPETFRKIAHVTTFR